MSKFKKVEGLAGLNQGAVEELFDPELKKVLNNLADNNTSWKAGREINIKIKLRLTSESRDNAISEVSISSKLAQPKAHESNVFLDFDGKDVIALSKKEDNQPELINVTEFKKSEEA